MDFCRTFHILDTILKDSKNCSPNLWVDNSQKVGPQVWVRSVRAKRARQNCPPKALGGQFPKTDSETVTETETGTDRQTD